MPLGLVDPGSRLAQAKCACASLAPGLTCSVPSAPKATATTRETVRNAGGVSTKSRRAYLRPESDANSRIAKEDPCMGGQSTAQR
jgi:hypothetical protein